MFSCSIRALVVARYLFLTDCSQYAAVVDDLYWRVRNLDFPPIQPAGDNPDSGDRLVIQVLRVAGLDEEVPALDEQSDVLGQERQQRQDL